MLGGDALGRTQIFTIALWFALREFEKTRTLNTDKNSSCEVDRKAGMRLAPCSVAGSVGINLRGTKLRRSNLFAVGVLCALFIFAAVTTASGAESERDKRVLMISTGSRFSPGFALVDQGVLEALAKIPSTRVETYAENLDILRFPTERFQRIFTEYLAEKYAEQRPDLIILVYVGNVGIAGKLLQQLFPGTPIIVAGFTEEEVRTDQFGPLVSGIAQRVDPRANLELILRLQPETRRIVVIGGTAEVDRNVLNRAREAARSFAGRVEFEFWDNRSMAELRKGVTALPPQTAILVSRMFRDGAGQAVISTQAGQEIAQWANVPVYAMVDATLGTGAVGGSVGSIEAFGRRAGELARLILTGTAPASLPFEIRTNSVPTFDWRALKRWSISESRLPPGSMVRFRPTSMWEQYRWYIIGALLIIAIQTAMIVDFLVQRARRRRAEGGLLESQQFMELATEAGGIGLWVRDLVRGDLWVNPRLRSLLGFGQAEVLGVDDVLARVHPDDRAQVMSVVERAQESGKPFDVEFRTAELPGVPQRWVATRGQLMRGPQGQPLRRMGTMIDITGPKLAEQALSESEENFRRLVETTAAVIWQADIESWMFTYVGPQAVKLLGYPLEQWYEKDFWVSHIHPDDRQRAVDTCLTMTRTAEEFEFDYRMINVSGEAVWVHDIVNCQHQNGKPKQLRGLMLDITERKRVEAELQEQRAELAHVARVSVMGELAASLAHELYQPLTAILSNAQAALRFMASKPVNLEEVREILNDIVKDNSRASDVIRRMRALVKKEELEFATLDLASLIRDVVVLLHSDAILQNVTVVLELDDRVRSVRGDKVQLQQVVLNLLLNAFDAMKECPVSEREVKLEMELYGANLIRVAVSDSGTGLSGDKLDKIFEPFYTTKREGLGMGLSISRSIIEAHGGRLWAENNPNRGATFYFTVPVDCGDKEKKN
jgi:PAS domain S-box-containing protein